MDVTVIGLCGKLLRIVLCEPYGLLRTNNNLCKILTFKISLLRSLFEYCVDGGCLALLLIFGPHECLLVIL